MSDCTMIGIEVELMDPVIVSDSAATAADPSTLDYIPGAMLWGVYVAQCYTAGMAASDIFGQYYQGKVIFGDAYCVAPQGGLALPTPKSIHRPKLPCSSPGTSTDFSQEWKDFSSAARCVGYKELAKSTPNLGPCAVSGPVPVEVASEASLRTAIDPDTGIAAESQFFGLSALSSGQRFVAPVVAPDRETADKVAQKLAGDHILGRSRMAEFGRVRLRPTESLGLPEVGTEKADILWCLSDLAAHDIFGVPTECPDETFFGAPVDWARSFVRHRRYSPFNRTWGCRAPERIVIARGSVLTLKDGTGGGSDSQPSGGFTSGLHRFGYHTEMGLGLVLACPGAPLDILREWSVAHTTDAAGETEQAQTHLTQSQSIQSKIAHVGPTPSASVFPEADTEGDTGYIEEKTGASDLARLLAERVRTRTAARVRSEHAAHAWEDSWKCHYERAKALTGSPAGPTPTQWAMLAGIQEDTALCEKVTGLGSPEGAEARREAQSWQARFAEGQDGTFVAAARAVLEAQGAGSLRVLAKRLREELIREEWFDGA